MRKEARTPVTDTLLSFGDSTISEMFTVQDGDPSSTPRTYIESQA